MQIAVLGGGNGSTAAAVDLTEHGHNVRFWRRNGAAQTTLRAKDNMITLKDFKGTRPVQIGIVTGDMAEALAGAELIVCPTPATAQADIARLMAPHLRDGQVVFLPPAALAVG